jgi:hypothetical protein
MAMCVGYMSGFSGGAGRPECEQFVAQGGALGECIAHVLAGTARTSGRGICGQAAVEQRDPYLQDCLLGLADLSHVGYTSCRLYYERG